MDSPPAHPDDKANTDTGCMKAFIWCSIAFVGLVVLLIIVALVRPVGGIVMKQARHAQTLLEAQTLRISLKSYHAEYGKFPVAEGESSPVLSEGKWLEAQLGNDHDLNPRDIQFCQYPPFGGRRAGLTAASPRSLVDNWGHPYCVLMDTSGDGKVPDPEHPGAMLTERIAIWSAGPDGDYTTWADNIKSW
jgi:hypothetical protein